MIPRLTSLIEAQDSSTPRGRARERYRRIALTTVTSIAARGMTMLTVLISVPLTVRYLGTERYAVWMTISSVVAMLTFADLGIGNGLLNAISESHGKDDPRLASQYVSSAFFLLSATACVVVTVGVIAYPLVSWGHFFNLSSPLAIREAGPATAVFVVCFALDLPFGVVERVQLGYQEGFVRDLWSVFGKIVGLSALLLGIFLRVGLPWLVLAMTGGPVLARVLNTFGLFTRSRPWLRPRLALVSKSAAIRLLRMGGYFFVLQTCVAVATGADNFIVARLLGPSAVTEFAVTFRMFSIVPIMLIITLNPLWPAYGESIARGEVGWALATLRRSLVAIFVATSLSSVFLALFGHWLLRIWVGPEINPTTSLLIAIGASVVFTTGANGVGVFLNGANLMKVEVLSGVSVALGATVFKVFFVRRVGLCGIPLGTILAYALFVWVPIALFVPKLLSKMQLSYRVPCVSEAALE